LQVITYILEDLLVNLKKNISDLKKFIREDFKGETALQSVKKEVELLKVKIDRTMEKEEKSLGLNLLDIMGKGVGIG
jgi:hypothetical protein